MKKLFAIFALALAGILSTCAQVASAATITATSADDGRGATIYTWAAMGNADTGTSVAAGYHPVRSVQITGTFGSATVVLQGSNDGSNWATLTDTQGNAISKTAAAIERIDEVTRYIRASTSGGTGTSVTVTVIVGRP